MVIAGAGAVVAGAVIYSLLSGGEDGERQAADELKAELAKIGEVNRDQSGTIKIEDFMNLFKLITKHAKKRIGQVKRTYSIQRRESLRKGLDDEYRNHVTEQMKEEEGIY
jgi:hypothetical protein